jgi:hypothetical protein
MSFLKYIDIYYFMFSFSLGLFFIYIWGADIKSVNIFPNPLNFNDYQFKDEDDSYSQYIPIEVECPQDHKEIKTMK